MYSFTNDYSEGGHPKVMEALQQTNEEQTDGYGLDKYCQEATNILKKLVHNDTVDVHYMVGGTQVNLTFIASALKPYQAVIAVDCGHINVHEAGSIEATGHKILTKSHQNGKLTISMISEILEEHPDEHMVKPKLVYISQTTEFGTAYTLEELKDLYTYCKKQNLYLFIDGARLGSALVLKDCPSIEQLTLYSDAFYIGGTKMGALFGECLVIINEDLKTDFRYHMKQRGAMLAKGRLLGIQFLTLFKDSLYLKIGEHENHMANLLKKGIIEAGYSFYIDTNTNQLFPIFPNTVIKELQKEFSFMVMASVNQEESYVRLVTSWATKEKYVTKFIKVLKKTK